MSGGHHHHDHATGNIRAAFFLNLSFAVIEIAGGFWTNSLAILSDAVHDLGDSLSIGMAWYLQHYSNRAIDKDYTYGYRRFSLLGALVNGIILTGGSLFIIYHAIQGFTDPRDPHAPGMVVFALLGIAVNGYAAWKLGRGLTHNEKTLKWHLLEDVLGWVAVLVVAVVLLFRNIPILDPALSILIALFILYNVFKNLRGTLALFLQKVPASLDVSSLEEGIRSLDGVKSVHHTHVWSLDGVHHVLTAHVVVDAATSREEGQEIRQKIRSMIRNDHITHVTIEIEYGSADCEMRV